MPRARRCQCCSVICVRRRLLAVADQDLIAGSAESRSMALQAVKNADDVVVGVFDDLLAKAHDVRTAGGALPCIPLALSRRYRAGRQCKRGRKNNRPKHMFTPRCGQSAAAPYVMDAIGATRRGNTRPRVSCAVWQSRIVGRPCAVRLPGDKSCLRAVSSVGRASALHAECRRFESVTAHQPSQAKRSEGCRVVARRGKTGVNPIRLLRLGGFNRPMKAAAPQLSACESGVNLLMIER
jgi:hypothetical protein